jgi:hypothetical protein
MSDPTIVHAIRREDPSNPVYSGEFPSIGGLRILATPNLPAAGAWVLDSSMLGGIAERGAGRRLRAGRQRRRVEIDA